MVRRDNAPILSLPVPIFSLLLSLALFVAAFAVAPLGQASNPTRTLHGTTLANSSGVPGYLEVGSDGSMYSFSTPNLGGMGGKPLNQPIVGMAATPNGLGYWEVASDGGIFTFGAAAFYGSMGGQSIPAPVVAMASTLVTSLVAPGATGYDISNWQCGGYPPQAPLYVVEVTGWPYSQTTPTQCLQSEVSWGGPQTQFYIFMGDVNPIPSGAPVAPSCPSGLTSIDCSGWQNGYSQAAYAYNISQNAAVHSSVWWLDVETSANSWSSSQSENYQAILGAMAALKSRGILVGVYSTYKQWPEIAGTGSALPSGTPIWVADWNTSNPSAACGQAIPFGGGFLAQVQTLPTNFDNDVSC